jgi:Zn-dependent protease
LTPEVTFDTITLGVIWYVVFLFSTTFHEGAHALVARLGGDPTASDQVTLNPIPHIQREPFGMVIVPILSYVLSGWVMGWASAPYDPTWSYRHPHRAARMALAGPAANFTLMVLAAVGIRVGVALGEFRPPLPQEIFQNGFTWITVSLEPGIGSLLATMLSVLFLLNLVLGTFNLLPLAPLDGSVGVSVLMSEDRARRFVEFMRNPQFVFLGLVLAWTVFGQIFPELFWPAMSALYYPVASYG